MQQKIKVALMTYAIDGRLAKGTAVVARKSVESLLRNRDILDLTFIHYEKSNDPIYSHGVREVIFPEFRFKILNRRFLRQIYYFLTTQDRFDIVHWYQPRLYPFFWLAPARYIVATLHGAGDWGKENHFNLMRHIFNWTLKLFNGKVSAAIAGSEYARNDIVKRYGFNPNSVYSINNGVDPMFHPATAEEIARIKIKYALPERFFLNVARLNPGKNAFRTIRAFDRFSRTSNDTDIHFVNIGAYGTDKTAVEKFLSQSHAKERIHLVGYVETEDLPAVYSAAFALVFPLLNEGYGLPLLEAMACGIPVVASDTAFPEFTPEDALLVDALSEEDIARAMDMLIKTPELRERLIRNGFLKARTKTWEAAGEKIIGIYKDLCGVR